MTKYPQWQERLSRFQERQGIVAAASIGSIDIEVKKRGNSFQVWVDLGGSSDKVHTANSLEDAKAWANSQYKSTSDPDFVSVW